MYVMTSPHQVNTVMHAVFRKTLVGLRWSPNLLLHMWILSWLHFSAHASISHLEPWHLLPSQYIFYIYIIFFTLYIFFTLTMVCITQIRLWTLASTCLFEKKLCLILLMACSLLCLGGRKHSKKDSGEESGGEESADETVGSPKCKCFI